MKTAINAPSCAYIPLLLMTFLIVVAMSSAFFRGSMKKQVFTHRSLSVGFDRTAGHHDSDAIQKIYDNLASIPDINMAAKFPKSSSQLHEVITAMEDVTLEDLGLNKEFLDQQKESVCMNIVLADEFHLSLFVILRGKGLQLYCYPGMCVILKLVFGSLNNLRSFSPAPVDSSQVRATGPAAGEFPIASSFLFPCNPRVSDRVKTRLTTIGTRTASNSAWLLSPNSDNIHEFVVPVLSDTIDTDRRDTDTIVD